MILEANLSNCPLSPAEIVIQCTFAINLIKHLGRLAKKLKVTVTTYYSGDYRYIKQKLQTELHGSTALFDIKLLQSLDASTVNAFIGGETDVQILVTNVDGPTILRAHGQSDEFDVEPDKFVFDDQTVALSRGAHGLFIIGDMNYLASQRTSKISIFLKFVELTAPAVQCEEYLQIMARANPSKPPDYDADELLVSTEHLVSNTAFNNSNWKRKWIAANGPRPKLVRPN